MLLATHRVRLTLSAARDLEQIFIYIGQHSPQNAHQMVVRLMDAIDSLDRLPHRYKIVPNTTEIGVDVRGMPVRPFLIRYHVDDPNRAVTVLSIQHGARQSR